MKFNRKTFIAIAHAAVRALRFPHWAGYATSRRENRDKIDGKLFDKLTSQQILRGLLLGIVILLCWRYKSLRAFVAIALSIGISALVGGVIGSIIGMRLRKLATRIISDWQPKQNESGYLHNQPLSTFSRMQSVRSQLRIAAVRSSSERLRLIAELQASIRSRSPNLSIQDLQDLNFLGRERQQIMDEQSWSPVRRSRVDRIAQIRNSRQANGRNSPAGLVEREDESEFTVTYSDLQHYGAIDYDDEPDGIGDLTCEYNAHSLFLRCAVQPGAETCEGCRDYRSAIASEPA